MAPWAVSPTLLALHPGHQMARLRVKRSSPKESQPARNRVNLGSGTAVLGWSRLKDGRRTHAQSSLLQWAPRRKAPSWCSKKTLQRSAEETSCTERGGGDGGSTISHCSRGSQTETVGGHHWIKASGNFEAERHEAVKERRWGQKERSASWSCSAQTCPKCSRVCASRIGLYSHRRAC